VFRRLGELPLQRKLALLIIGAIVSSQLLAGIGLLVWNLFSARRALTNDLETQARIVADNVAAALSFRDAEAATETLRGLRARPGFSQACLYDSQARLFAGFAEESDCAPIPSADGAKFDIGGLIISRAVMSPSDGRVGTLVLRSTLEPVTASLEFQSVGIALILIVSSIATLVVTRRFQRQLTLPLVDLASTAQAVSRDKDYSRRVKSTAGDEIGHLANAFNDMLAQIQVRDDELNRALRLKDEFLATVSHELRTPLNAIVGWVHVFRTANIPPELAAQAAEAIDRNAQRQVRLIEDILDVSRIVTGKLRLEPKAVELATIVESAVDVIEPTAAAKAIDVTVDLQRPSPMLGDPDRLRQIIWNLLSNAVKFTPRGGRIAVTLARSDDNYVIQITDTGPGIPLEFLPHLFEAFRQADGSPTRAHGGLGLGLAIARHLAELSGGRIEASSDGAGKGSTFTIHLPRPLDSRRDAIQEANSPEAAWQRLDGRAILLVDDDDDTRQALGTLLQAHGADVRTAASAQEAREALSHQLPDVLVTDLAMPGEDGYTLLNHCRHHPDQAVRDLPVIALTAYAGEQARARVMAAGFNAHLTKPIDPAAVSRVIAGLAR
jgi:signal transduction histidine kinase/ActR/RegA family two-component response regulator